MVFALPHYNLASSFVRCCGERVPPTMPSTPYSIVIVCDLSREPMLVILVELVVRFGAFFFVQNEDNLTDTPACIGPRIWEYHFCSGRAGARMRPEVEGLDGDLRALPVRLPGGGMFGVSL